MFSKAGEGGIFLCEIFECFPFRHDNVSLNVAKFAFGVWVFGEGPGG